MASGFGGIFFFLVLAIGVAEISLSRMDRVQTRSKIALLPYGNSKQSRFDRTPLKEKMTKPETLQVAVSAAKDLGPYLALPLPQLYPPFLVDEKKSVLLDETLRGITVKKSKLVKSRRNVARAMKNLNKIPRDAVSKMVVETATYAKVFETLSITPRRKTRGYRLRSGRILEYEARSLRTVNYDNLLFEVASSTRTMALMRNVWETFRLSRISLEDEVIRWDPKKEVVEFDPISVVPGVTKYGGTGSGKGPLAVSVIRGKIRGSLYKSILRAEGSGAMAVALANIFSWEVDFRSDIQPGDEFWIVAERSFRPDGKPQWGRVLGVMLEARGSPHRAIAFPDRQGRLSYYGEDGKPLKKVFLRSPVDFTRISSGYSHRRFHPILKTHRPHRGIDFVAPFGTPVRAVAKGVVIRAVWTRQGGRTIELRHLRRYSTKYHHLSRYAKGVRRGKRVARGEVIGYVGSTGLSTGPHLDFRVLDRGRPVNPLRLKQIAGVPIPGKDWKRFTHLRDAIFAYVRGPVWSVKSGRGTKMVAATSVNP